MKRRGELKLITQAIRNGWDISPQGRSDALALVAEVLDDDNATARERLAAARVVVQMTEHNMLADADAALLERVRRLGQRA